MRPFHRADRVAALMHRVLSDILQKEIKDPRLEKVTVTRVKLSSDLKFAKIHFSTLSGEIDRAAAAAGFKDATGFIKRALSQSLDLRFIPDLKFFYDESYDHASKIFSILNSLKSENGTDHRQAEEQ